MFARGSARRSMRRGVVLLVVISLLMLFAIVGIAFVIYSQAQASTARIYKESEALRRPDMDPEELLAYFLGQLIYDTDNPYSALRGHSLARNMYGKPGNFVPFSGTGRLRNADYGRINYTMFGGVARNPDQDGSPNPPYTYPDINHPFLAAVRASDGAVLQPSYQRHAWTQFNGNWNDPSMRDRVLRPLPADHQGFPPPDDPGGDVKNLSDSPGYWIPGTNPPQFANNDSSWIDLGHPVMTAIDGRKFKPLFAPLIVDLDNRLNINIHGNIRGENFNPDRGRYAGGEMAFGPWDVNLETVLRGRDRNEYNPNNATLYPEARRIFIGHRDLGLRGRYNHRLENPPGLWGDIAQKLPVQYRVNGNFHVGSGQYDPSPGGLTTRLPGFLSAPRNSAFPYFNHDGGNDADLYGGTGHSNHPILYNFFTPELNYYLPMSKDRHFGVSNMEALLRYGDSGSPALNSDLFHLLPQSLLDPKARRLITTHSFDIDQPGVMPWLWNAPGAPKYELSAGAAYPKAGPVPFPPPGTPPPNSEFTPDWRAVTAGLGRINLNRDMPWGSLPAYPMIAGGRMSDSVQFGKALAARQRLADEIFLTARLTTGAADPASAAPGSPEFLALRWLAQLSVNIVDFIDRDDFNTPFDWRKQPASDWVFGVELPRLVLNEAYAEAAYDSGQNSLVVNFWVELFNPWHRVSGWTSGNGSQDGVVPNLGPNGLTPNIDNHYARLQVRDANNPTDPQRNWAAYKVVIASPNTKLRDRDNARGEPDAGSVKLEVADYSPEPAPTAQPQAGVDYRIVQAKHTRTTGTNGNNDGWYLLGPKADFPAKDPMNLPANLPKATLRVKDQQINGVQNAMSYKLGQNVDFNNLPKHTILLRRLACPYMPVQDNPGLANYNPYVTVDYLREVATNDGADKDENGQARQPASVDQRFAVGRNQPFAADQTQQVEQKPLTALVDQPQHTFFKSNVQVIDQTSKRGKTDPPNMSWGYDWLVCIDRQLLNPIELLQVCSYRPHELTQQFMTGGTDAATGKPSRKFDQRAPWYDPASRLFRLFEFVTASAAVQWVPAGGRTIGKINLNTTWERDIFDALSSTTNTPYHQGNFLTDCYQQMMRQRTPGGRPAPGDRPFMGFAVPFSTGDAQFPAGIGMDDTFLAADQRDTNPDPTRRKRLFEPTLSAAEVPAVGQQQLRNEANGHPFIRSWFMRKLFTNLTTRSNVFAVYLTVGFFEVVDDSDPSRPPVLGPEIGRAENRHLRHRMFAIVDRSNITVGFDPGTRQIVPNQPGARPFFIPSHSAVELSNNAPAQATIKVPGVTGRYEAVPWSIKPNDMLVADTGLNQEVITVIKVDALAAPPTLTAVFTKPHASRFALSNAVLGNPGPQSRFDPRNPNFNGVVRFISIVE